jgi:formate/nitrite transporter FocA (FNT family)
MNDPVTTMRKLIAAGDGRADRPPMQIFASACLGGIYLSFGPITYSLRANVC